MNFMLMFVFILPAFLVLTVTKNPGDFVRATTGEVWPRPVKERKTANFMTVKPLTFKFVKLNQTCEIIDRATRRYLVIMRRMLKHRHAKFKMEPGNIFFLGALRTLYINLTAPCENRPYMHMDEKYHLAIGRPELNVTVLSSQSVWGILRGLETFSQLLHARDQENVLTIYENRIEDYPRFTHRGLMLDTGRHYISVKIILKIIAALSYNKMNILHWHMTDDQSFPYMSKSFPELSEFGAYHSSLSYTSTDVKRIIEYARLRGIRVIPEIDSPAHTASWGLSHYHLQTTCFKNGKALLEKGPLNPIKTDTYDFLELIYEELLEVFQDEFVHIGGNDINTSCWNSNPEIIRFMTKKLKNKQTLKELYLAHLLRIVDRLDANSILWNDAYTPNLLPNVIYQVWTNSSDLVALAELGRYVIHSQCWFLNKPTKWTDFYKCDPHAIVTNADDQKFVLGGEVCMWGGYVNNHNILPKIWPLASITAEKLWSKQNAATIRKVRPRLEEHICRMITRKIPTQPVNGPGMCITR